MGNWAFSWVQIMAHNKFTLLLFWGAVTVLTLFGVPQLDFTAVKGDLLLLAISLVAMSLVVGYLLESPKVALLQFSLSGYILVMTFGLLGWSGYTLTEEAILGLVVVMTLISSNLVHVLSTLLREMARGQFQYDALAEALRLNAAPVFLSNITTALGFVFTAWLDPSYVALAWLVVFGVSVSFIVTLSWLPMILLNWLLEFRVGNPADRHGLTFIASWLQSNPLYRKLIIAISMVVGLGLIVLNWNVLQVLEQLLWLLGVFIVLFWLFWRSVTLALLNLGVNFLALLVSISVFSLVFGASQWLLLLWMVPLGLIIDDGIHFFTRYVRAKHTMFADAESAVVFSMASVGRPIWITSWVLVVGLGVLLFSANEMVVNASLLTIFALLIATFSTLTMLPAMLMSGNKKSK